jgi:NDP-sugar pyrophosphorylase family protein
MRKKNIVLLLSGGYGSRLYPLTFLLPKIFIPFKGKILLEHHINSFRDIRIDRIYVNLFKKVIYYLLAKFFKDKNKNLDFIFEKKPLGTILPVANILQKKKFDNLVILYSDTFFLKEQPLIINKLLKASNNKFMSISVSKSYNKKYLLSKGIVKFKNGNLLSFIEKPKNIKSYNNYFFSGIIVIPSIIKKQVLKILSDAQYIEKNYGFAEKVFFSNKIKTKVCISKKIPLDFGNWKNLIKNYFTSND